MKFDRSWWSLVLAGLAVIVGLPLAGSWLRRHTEPRCALDGLKIEPLYRARVVDRANGSHDFCCVRCAAFWLARQEKDKETRKHPDTETRTQRPDVVYVTDEASGEEIDSQSAHFVYSAVVTNPITGNHVHVFRNRADAEHHVGVFGGWALTGAERPLP
jgi:hypothetical protein